MILYSMVRCMNKNRFFNILVLILWLVIIFIMSSFNASDSGSQSNIIVSIISRIFNIKEVSILSFLIRKLAHFTEYFILGILSLNCFKDYSQDKKVIYFSIAFCIFYAMTDEFHQTFIPGRAGAIKDVLIDSFGTVCGSILHYNLFLKKVFKSGKQIR